MISSPASSQRAPASLRHGLGAAGPVQELLLYLSWSHLSSVPSKPLFFKSQLRSIILCEDFLAPQRRPDPWFPELHGSLL